ncbi:MAG: 6-phosphogluconolactonase [Pseudomonadota bacterium]
MNLKRHIFSSQSDLTNNLAQSILGQLSDAIQERGLATLAVSGGSTPVPLFQALSRIDFDWAKVTIVLVDERWLPNDDERSNERLVRQHLLRNHASDARLIKVYSEAPSIEKGVADLEQRLDNLSWPLDVTILGMGTDGHTASLFPDGDQIVSGLDPHGRSRVTPMRAPSVPEDRVSLTLPAISGCPNVVLHITGDEKIAALNAAMSSNNDNELPIKTVLEACNDPKLFWAP